MPIIRIAVVVCVFTATFLAAADKPIKANDQDQQQPAAKELPELEVGKPIALFDGETLDGWTTDDGKPVTNGWKVEDGTIFRESRGGNIVYHREVGDFELSFQWKIAKGGNSGLKYRVRRYGGRLLGCEYQLLGETKRRLSKGSCGSLYELYEPNEQKQLNPPGEWNTAKIVAHGPKIEHWMNGQKIVAADLMSDQWRKRLSQSKFSTYEDFARNSRGQIMLTEHGSQVWYRDIVLTPLPTKEIPPLPKQPPNIVCIMSDELAPWELYDLAKDVSETNNVADVHPEVLAQMQEFAKQAHEPVRPGTFSDRTRHERDRAAKWGSSRESANTSGD